MGNEHADAGVIDIQQEQMLRLITKGFYKELINYGIEKKRIVTVSSHLLDYLLQDLKDSTLNKHDEYYNTLFTVTDVKDEWNERRRLSLAGVSISTLQPEQYPQVAKWLENPDIKFNFIPPFPETERGLKEYFAGARRVYFSISYEGEPVGLIGADSMDSGSHKLEMKKLIGNSSLRGKGIGKQATFLFLYYAFNILRFHKVYIHSGDTNIRNIILNSKFGFELEGIFFDDVHVQNKKKDVVRMGLLRPRWAEIFSPPSMG